MPLPTLVALVCSCLVQLLRLCIQPERFQQGFFLGLELTLWLEYLLTVRTDVGETLTLIIVELEVLNHRIEALVMYCVNELVTS